MRAFVAPQPGDCVDQRVSQWAGLVAKFLLGFGRIEVEVAPRSHGHRALREEGRHTTDARTKLSCATEAAEERAGEGQARPWCLAERGDLTAEIGVA